MSIKTNELQQIAVPQLTDTLLMAGSVGGTAQLPLAQAAAWFGAEMVKAGNPVGAALSSKANVSAQDKIDLTEPKSRYVELAASELQAYIDALPRFLTEKLALLVSGELETAVELKHFCGPGLLVVNGKSRGNFTLRNRLFVQNCSVPVHLYNIEFQEREDSTSHLLYVEDSGCVYCYACDFRGLGAQSRYTAVFVDNGSRVRLASPQISGCFAAAEACRASILSVENGVEDADCEFRDNRKGAFVWENGIILLDPKVPDTLGGSANIKSGGLIAKGNGTLL